MNLCSWDSTLNIKAHFVLDLLVLEWLIRFSVKVVRVVHTHSTHSAIALLLLVPAEPDNNGARNFTGVSQLEALSHFVGCDTLRCSNVTSPYTAERKAMGWPSIVLWARKNFELHFVPQPSFVIGQKSLIWSIKLYSKWDQVDESVVSKKFSTWQEVWLDSLTLETGATFARPRISRRWRVCLFLKIWNRRWWRILAISLRLIYRLQMLLKTRSIQDFAIFVSLRRLANFFMLSGSWRFAFDNQLAYSAAQSRVSIVAACITCLVTLYCGIVVLRD